MATPDDEYQNIRLEHEESLTWIVLDRPDRANALSNDLLEEFSLALEHLRDHGGPVIAIRGAGKGFSAGYDLGQVATGEAPDPSVDRARLQRTMDRYRAIWDHPKPIVGVVHGYCIAGASQLVTFTDLTLVAEDARIGQVTIPVGAGYVTPTWAPLVGPKRAKEIAFVPGNYIDGKTAVEWGWANHAVPADRLLDAARSLARRIALTPPEVLQIKKASINRAMGAMGWREATAAVADADALAHTLPAVHSVRDQLATDGLKAVMARYRAEPTSDLS